MPLQLVTSGESSHLTFTEWIVRFCGSCVGSVHGNVSVGAEIQESEETQLL